MIEVHSKGDGMRLLWRSCEDDLHPPIAEGARLMQGRRLRRLPVTDSQGRLAGVITRADVLSIGERPDRHIRAEPAEVAEVAGLPG